MDAQRLQLISTSGGGGTLLRTQALPRPRLRAVAPPLTSDRAAMRMGLRM